MFSHLGFHHVDLAITADGKFHAHFEKNAILCDCVVRIREALKLCHFSLSLLNPENRPVFIFKA